jgi:beta-xylosidase
VAIGAYLNDDNGNNSGQVRIYEYNGTAWIQLGANIDGEAAGDLSGYSVSLSSDGTRVAIGAPGGNGNDSGQVRIYEYNGTAWTQLGGDIDGEAADDESGYSVSLSSDGTRVAIGAYLNDDNGNNSGQVRIYEYNGTAWTQLGDDIDGAAANDQSGVSVSLSSDGTRVAIGAPENDSNGTDSGHVRVYKYSGTAWDQVGGDIDGEVGQRLGFSVSLSSDGTRVAIGAPVIDSGQVRIYDYNGTAWTQVGDDIDGEAVSDRSGTSVSLSSDGKRVAIGAPENDSRAGHVRVYRFASVSSAPTPVPTLPLFGLGILVSLLGLFGLRKLRQ